MLPSSKTTFLILTQFATHSYPLSSRYLFFVARNQPHHTIYHESDPIACSLVDFPVHWRPIYAFTVSICTTSKLSAWRQGNTVTNCNNSRPGAIWIHDTGCYVLFLFFFWFTRAEADNWDVVHGFQKQDATTFYLVFAERLLYALWCESFSNVTVRSWKLQLFAYTIPELLTCCL